MAALHKLTVPQINSKQTRKLSDGGGLWFHRRKDGGGQWFQRFTLHGIRHEMGLGSVDVVSLKQARTLAESNRVLVRSGKNPIKERERLKQVAVQKLHILSDVAADAFESRKADLRGDGSDGRWMSPLEQHVLPRLGKMPVSEIDQKDIRDTLTPIWHSKAHTAKKAINRLGICIKHAAALGLDVDLQAVDKAKALLGKQRHKTVNIPALEWREVPDFYASLNDGGITHLALRLLILTAVRSKSVRFAHIDQFNGNIWTIPGELIKGRRDSTSDFRVPLSSEAMKTVEAASAFERDGYLFPNTRKGVISDATMARLMQRRKLEARPHGFRTSFRTWVQDTQITTYDVAETILGHSIGGKIERTYARSDLFEQRAVVMERWASHVCGCRGSVLQMVKI